MTAHAVTVIICAHQLARWPWLVKAVGSVGAQSVSVARIVVVIDGDAALAALAREELASTCLVIERPERGGLSAARNTGIEAVDTPLVAFLDDDAEAEPTWLASLMAPMVDPFVLGVGGRAEPMPERPMPAWFPPELYWALGCTYEGLPDSLSEVRNVFGGCAVYRTELFQAIGGFSELLGRKAAGLDGCEETELCLRALAAFPKSRILYEPKAVIHHLVPSARMKLSYLLRRSRAEGRSKATLAKLVGTSGKLGPEVQYLRRTVPRSIVTNLRQVPRNGVAPLQRVCAVLLSVAVAGAAYLGALWKLRDTDFESEVRVRG